MRIKQLKLAIRKTYEKTIKIYLDRKRPCIIKDLRLKLLQTGWELKVVVSGTEPIRIAFDWREERMQIGEISTLKISYPCHP